MTKNLDKLNALRIGDQAVFGLLLLKELPAPAVTRVCTRPLTRRFGSFVSGLLCLPAKESRNLGCCCGRLASLGCKQDARTGRTVVTRSCSGFCIVWLTNKECGQDRGRQLYLPLRQAQPRYMRAWHLFASATLVCNGLCATVVGSDERE